MQDPTSDQHAQRQSDMLPTTDQSTHEGQTAHGAELNDFATSLTDKPGLDEANEARRDAREAVSSLKSVSGPVQTALSGINDAGHLVAAVDHIIPLLGNLSKFNSLVDTIAEIHPYAKAACGVLSVVSKTITLQATRDDSISQLLSKMDEVYIFLTENDLAALTSMKSVVVRICQQTLECSYFLRDYSKSKNFWIRLGRNVVSETDGRVKGYNTVFDDLMQQFRDRAARDTVVVVHRIKLEGIQELGVSLTLTQPMTQHMTQSLRRLT
ncbi:uncharacterized protein HD556DRAFT_1380511 [Suillus plorans]|uniref:Fungal STAND N-terminal Goodbye domain-containing protein n=1 Tax=Suillus plorans TaxID=116603 RepID=A0A9P7ANF5_9AGAM|nr:uncharacterized protein HD556DRAFT_1380511 [Suillus plorans]KAG1792328.1 hypothetical protein HD556DRAFT_1380511 [Suillus plorans]